MKRISLFIFLVAFYSSLRAADISHSVGIEFGYAQPTYRLNAPKETGSGATSLSSTQLHGIKIGLVYDLNLIRGFGLSTAVHYTYGYHLDDWEAYPYDANGHAIPITTYELKTRYDFHQIELALDLQYKFAIAKNTHNILYTGPTIQYIPSMTARDTWRTKIGGNELNEHPYAYISWDYSNGEMAEYYKQYNVTWGIGAGFQYQWLYLRGGYDFGLINPYNFSNFSSLSAYSQDRLTRGRLDQWQIKIGFYFWRSDK